MPRPASTALVSGDTTARTGTCVHTQ
jgi:hypothetical protein